MECVLFKLQQCRHLVHIIIYSSIHLEVVMFIILPSVVIRACICIYIYYNNDRDEKNISINKLNIYGFHDDINVKNN